jgi:hypothetical protein
MTTSKRKKINAADFDLVFEQGDAVVANAVLNITVN